MSDTLSPAAAVRKPAPWVGRIMKGAVTGWLAFLVFFLYSKFAPADFWKKETGALSIAQSVPTPVPTDYLDLSLGKLPLRVFEVPLGTSPTKWIRLDPKASQCRVHSEPDLAYTIIPSIGRQITIPSETEDFSLGEAYSKPFRLVGSSPGQTATITLFR